MDWTEIWKWIAGVIAALIAGGLVIKLAFTAKSSKRKSVRVVVQKDIKAGGDVIGGDSIKKTKN